MEGEEDAVIGREKVAETTDNNILKKNGEIMPDSIDNNMDDTGSTTGSSPSPPEPTQEPGGGTEMLASPEMPETPLQSPVPPEMAETPMASPETDGETQQGLTEAGAAVRLARKRKKEVDEQARLQRVAEAMTRRRLVQEQDARNEERKQQREELRLQRVAEKVASRRATQGMTEEEIRLQKVAEKVAARRAAREAEIAKEKAIEEEKNKPIELPKFLRPDQPIDPELLERYQAQQARNRLAAEAAAFAEANPPELEVLKYEAPPVDDFVSDRRQRVAMKAAARRAARLVDARKAAAGKAQTKANGQEEPEEPDWGTNGHEKEDETMGKENKQADNTGGGKETKPEKVDKPKAKKGKAKAKKGAKKKGGAKKTGVKKKGKNSKGKAKAKRGKAGKGKKKAGSSSSSSDSDSGASSASGPSPGAMAIAKALACGEAMPTPDEMEKIEQSKNQGPSFAWERPINVAAGTSIILSDKLGGVCIGVQNSQVMTFGTGVMRGPRASPQEVEKFVIESNLGKDCADRVRGLTKEMQRTIIDMGPVAGARSTDGVVFRRVQEVEAGRQNNPLGNGTFASSFTSQCALSSKLNPDIEEFIMKNRLDPQASNMLRRLPAERTSEALNLPVQHAARMGQNASQFVIQTLGPTMKQQTQERDRFSRDPTADAVGNTWK